MSDNRKPVIVWIRQDLRFDDNPALFAGSELGCPVIPVYILESNDGSRRERRSVAAAWTSANLDSFREAIRTTYDSRLVIRCGDAEKELGRLAIETQAAAVYFNSINVPHEVSTEKRVSDSLNRLGIEVMQFVGNLLAQPGSILNGKGNPYRVFTPFYRHFRKTIRLYPPLPVPSQLAAPRDWPDSLPAKTIENYVHTGFTDPILHWPAGESAGKSRLESFIQRELDSYDQTRDLLSQPATSGISPYLNCGTLSIRRVLNTVEQSDCAGSESFIRQLIWREFCYETLHNHPSLMTNPVKPEFESFPWDTDESLSDHWRRGLTGYPLVDAAMRQLYLEGWIHGRLRMVAASFLTKHLLQNWVDGEWWFRDRLVDADLACNAFNWQWVAGCGLDASPWFRIFNPVTQGRKFDPEGHYVRKYVPELAALPDKYIHSPWAAPAAVLDNAGIALGTAYPEPVVNHSIARQRALSTYYSFKNTSNSGFAGK